MSKLDEVIKNINSKMKYDLITTDINAVAFNSNEAVPFPTPALTSMFPCGFRTKTLWCFAGEFSSAKTSTAMAIAGCFQKYYKQKWENRVAELQALDKPNKNEKKELLELLDNGYKKVAFIDVERTADSDWASKMHFDMDDCIYVKPTAESAEDLFDIVLDLIRSDGICLVIIDSLAAMFSEAQAEKSMKEKTYGGIASVVTTAITKIVPLLGKHDCSVICINQLRQTLGAQFPTWHMPCGEALKYHSSAILFFKKGKAIDESYKEIPNKSETYFGQYIDIHMNKSKIAKPTRRIVTTSIIFDKGLYPLLDTINMAIDYGIISKSGAWYELDDEEGNPIIDSDNETMKWQGLTNTVKYFETHEKEYQDLFNKVTAEVCKED